MCQKIYLINHFLSFVIRRLGRTRLNKIKFKFQRMLFIHRYSPSFVFFFICLWPVKESNGVAFDDDGYTSWFAFCFLLYTLTTLCFPPPFPLAGYWAQGRPCFFLWQKTTTRQQQHQQTRASFPCHDLFLSLHYSLFLSIPRSSVITDTALTRLRTRDGEKESPSSSTLLPIVALWIIHEGLARG